MSQLLRQVLTVETYFLNLSRIHRQSRLNFRNVKIKSLDPDQVETNRDPQADIKVFVREKKTATEKRKSQKNIFNEIEHQTS